MAGRKTCNDSTPHAEVRGPSAGVDIGADGGEAKAFVKAELGSVSASAGPVTSKLGLAADTGAQIGPDGVEAKVLGTGISVGRKMGVSLFGSELSFKLW